MNRFVDEVVLQLTAGHGGAGAVSFLRAKYKPRGGPDGGDGGRGGDVVLVCKPNLKTLSQLAMRDRMAAENGEPGAGSNRDGRAGAAVRIEVPPGTVVYDHETGEARAELLAEGEEVVLLRGGRGGRGNAHFKTAHNRAPRFAQPGEPGDAIVARFELRLIADIGFLGRPNAGKSSLLRALTAARPKVAAYQFTTRTPYLGVFRRYERDVVLADVPGIIEGAASGAGLGTTFLKHLGRTAAIAFVVELGSGIALESYRLLEQELGRYSVELTRKPRLVVANKLDLDPDRTELNSLTEALEHETAARVVAVSTATGDGLDKLRNILLQLADETGQIQESASGEQPGRSGGEAHDKPDRRGRER